MWLARFVNEAALQDVMFRVRLSRLCHTQYTTHWVFLIWRNRQPLGPNARYTRACQFRDTPYTLPAPVPRLRCLPCRYLLKQTEAPGEQHTADPLRPQACGRANITRRLGLTRALIYAVLK